VLNSKQQAELAQLTTELQASKALDSGSLLHKRAVTEAPQLSYDPRASEFMDRIQASTLALTENELSALGKNGFVISKRSAFPTFVRGYAAIYFEHLPVYVSADAILEAVHASYDDLLSTTETLALSPTLKALLDSMSANLPGLVAQNPASAADLDVYLTVARSFLQGTLVSPVAGGDRKLIEKLYEMGLAASGTEEITLFGAKRNYDASQLQPRGHYIGGLEPYFRAMMWLGRTDFRLIETESDGSQKFLRGQYDAMLLLRQAMASADLDRFHRIDAALQGFLGESDYMTVPDVDALISDLGGIDAARAATDSSIEAAIRQGGYGIQRIASQIMVNDGSVETLPLARSFAFFGQRYVLDSHVFSQVVYDRVPSKRMMPNPLDVAFAALRNDQALPLLQSDLEAFDGYPGKLEGARVLADAHGDDFWNSNLYNLWLSSLRALSPAPDVSSPSSAGMPEVTGTNAWGRRILSTQLGSWAELRHDTLLYAKQSYTGTPACEYPDAYVDPYPEFYDQLRRFAERGGELAELLSASLGLGGDNVKIYFTKLAEISTTLGQMAQNQRQGKPFTDEQLAFVNRAVRVVQDRSGCTVVETPDGWLADLYLNREKSIEASPTIADVHTQPADEAGNTVGKVLHVGTGYPRLMVTTVDTCQGPRAYVGVTFAYHERVETDFHRLTDAEWKMSLPTAADVPWLTPVLAE
jgi:hypothetical protein